MNWLRDKLHQLSNPSPESMVKLHTTAMVAWVAVTPITLTHPDSVMWVSFMSQYANFVGHFASLDAARSERTSQEELEKVQHELKELRQAIESSRQPG